MSEPQNIGMATLKKLKSADGHWVVRPGELEQGQALMIDLDSRRHGRFANKDTGFVFEADVIKILDGDVWRECPVELLEIEP